MTKKRKPYSSRNKSAPDAEKSAAETRGVYNTAAAAIDTAANRLGADISGDGAEKSAAETRGVYNTAASALDTAANRLGAAVSGGDGADDAEKSAAVSGGAEKSGGAAAGSGAEKSAAETRGVYNTAAALDTAANRLGASVSGAEKNAAETHGVYNTAAALDTAANRLGADISGSAAALPQFGADVNNGAAGEKPAEFRTGAAAGSGAEKSGGAAAIPQFGADVNNGAAGEKPAEFRTGAADKKYSGLPVVAIAGRPNVGKSTLFNRFMQRRLAITDPTPGVTRDPVEGDVFLCGKPVHLIDTGGYKLQRGADTKEAELDGLVAERSLETIRKADLILLLLEAGQITGEDEEFIHLLRPYWNKVIAAVNKTEGGRNEDAAWNYARFGFSELFLISAEHGDRITELAEHIVSRLDFSRAAEADGDEPVRIAILGKPNTGKSTLSNRLTHSEASIVSDYAGTTRDTVEGAFSYGGKNFVVLDTAGIRRKARVRENVEYYSVNRAIRTLDECDIVFLMIDAQEGLSEQDKKICSLAYERGRGIIFVLNKWDTQAQDKKTLKKACENINIMFAQMDFAPITAVSALEGKGIKNLLNTALEMYGQLTRRVETSALNAALKDWLFRYPPPASKAIHFKVRYITQTGVNPVSFLIFATKPESVPETYVTFLKNRIREDLGFDKIPVQLEMRSSRVKWEDRRS